jgi:hypothetical protein
LRIADYATDLLHEGARRAQHAIEGQGSETRAVYTFQELVLVNPNRGSAGRFWITRLALFPGALRIVREGLVQAEHSARSGLVRTHEMPDLFDLLFRPASHDELSALAWPFTVFRFEKVQDRFNEIFGVASRLRRSLFRFHVSQKPFG